MRIPDTPGDALTEAQRREALSSFVNRYTGEHKPAWARKEWKDGKPYPVQFATDSEWLRNTRFIVLRNKRLGSECHSTPTWPMNPELRK